MICVFTMYKAVGEFNYEIDAAKLFYKNYFSFVSLCLCGKYKRFEKKDFHVIIIQ